MKLLRPVSQAVFGRLPAFIQLVGGLALVEVVFGWPGLGWQAVEAARNLDVPLVGPNLAKLSYDAG